MEGILYVLTVKLHELSLHREFSPKKLPLDIKFLPKPIYFRLRDI